MEVQHLDYADIVLLFEQMSTRVSGLTRASAISAKFGKGGCGPPQPTQY